jgi:cystathionine beta-synthase
MRDNRLLDAHFVKAGEVLRRKSAEVPGLVAVAESDLLRDALDLIKRYNISQLPVRRNGEIVGCVEESAIMSRVLEDAHALDVPVGRIMDKPLMRISVEEPVDQVVKLLAGRNAVLVEETGEAKGILTRIDLIEYVVT